MKIVKIFLIIILAVLFVGNFTIKTFAENNKTKSNKVLNNQEKKDVKTNNSNLKSNEQKHLERIKKRHLMLMNRHRNK